MLQPESKSKSVVRLATMATLPALEQVKRNFDNPNSVAFIWRKVDQHAQWTLNVLMPNASDCVNLICKFLISDNVGI